MKLRKVLLARVIRLFTSTGTVGYLPDIVKQIQERYQFITAPEPQTLLPTAQRGAEFQHGKLQRPDGSVAVVDKLTLFNDGLVIDTTSSTNIASEFLDDLIEWARQELPNTELKDVPLFLSQLEVNISINWATTLPTAVTIGIAIRDHLDAYGLKVTTPVPVSLTIGAEPPSGVGGLQPSTFTIERRANIPYRDNIYYSQAPLQTQDHIRLLELIEEHFGLP
jgi:hypothetical protein